MNREERRQKRQQDTKQAILIFVILVMAIILAIAGAVFGINKLLSGKKPANEQDTQTQQEQSQNTDAEGEQEEEQEEQASEPVINPAKQEAINFVAGMTLEAKVAQMFVITPTGLTGYGGATIVGETTRKMYDQRPVGGILYLEENLLDPPQTLDMMTKMNELSKQKTGLPIFLGLQEEGGSVARIAGHAGFSVTNVGNMSDIGASGDAQNAYLAGTTIGQYMKELGFNLNFAPVADVVTDAGSAIGSRAFGSDSQLVAQMVESELKGLSEKGIYGVVKHFPGVGSVSGDSHNAVLTSEKTLEQLMEEDLVPFRKAIDAGASFIMVGHIALPNVTGDNTPASLSQKMITEILRSQMKYDGIVITDAMNVKAITDTYTADAAAVAAVNAGADMILMPQDYDKAYKGLLEAVQNGTVSESRINEAVVRIVMAKQQMAQ